MWRQTRVGLRECLFFLLRGSGKNISYSLVILPYVCIPRLDDDGRIQSRGIRGRLFAAVNTSVDAKWHKYRWLLWWNRASRFPFSRTISFNKHCLSLILCTIRRSRFYRIQLLLSWNRIHREVRYRPAWIWIYIRQEKYYIAYNNEKIVRVNV